MLAIATIYRYISKKRPLINGRFLLM